MSRIGLVAIAAVLSFAVTLALKRNAAGESQIGAPPGGSVAVAQAGEPPTPAAPEIPQGVSAAVAATAGVPEAPDTTGLLQESLGIDDLLDIVDADSADGFGPVNRRRFTAQLESDPALREALGD